MMNNLFIKLKLECTQTHQSSLYRLIYLLDIKSDGSGAIDY